MDPAMGHHAGDGADRVAPAADSTLGRSAPGKPPGFAPHKNHRQAFISGAWAAGPVAQPAKACLDGATVRSPGTVGFVPPVTDGIACMMSARGAA